MDDVASFGRASGAFTDRVSDIRPLPIAIAPARGGDVHFEPLDDGVVERAQP